MYYDDFLLYVSYHYYFRFFLPNSCQEKIFKTGIRIISIILDNVLSDFFKLRFLEGKTFDTHYLGLDCQLFMSGEEISHIHVDDSSL